MANSVKDLPRAGTWIELTGGAAPAVSFDFSNLGPASIYVQYVAAQPAATELGHLYKPGQGDKLSDMSRVWARVEVANAEVGSDAEVFVQEV